MSLHLEDGPRRGTSRVPDPDRVILTAGDDEALERVPVHRVDLRVMLLEHHLLPARCEVEDPRRAVVRACRELGRAHRARDVLDARVVVRLEHVLLVDDVVAVDDVARLVAGDEELLVVRPRHRVDALPMHITTLEMVEVQRVPHDQLALVAAGDDALALLHPLDLEERNLHLLVLALTDVVARHRVEVRLRKRLAARRLLRIIEVGKRLMLWAHDFCKARVAEDDRSVLSIEVVVELLGLVIVDLRIEGLDLVAQHRTVRPRGKLANGAPEL